MTILIIGWLLGGSVALLGIWIALLNMARELERDLETRKTTRYGIYMYLGFLLSVFGWGFILWSMCASFEEESGFLPILEIAFSYIIFFLVVASGLIGGIIVGFKVYERYERAWLAHLIGSIIVATGGSILCALPQMGYGLGFRIDYVMQSDEYCSEKGLDPIIEAETAREMWEEWNESPKIELLPMMLMYILIATVLLFILLCFWRLLW